MKRVFVLLLAACGGSATVEPDAGAPVEDAGADAGEEVDAGSPSDAGSCTTRVTYGRDWLKPANHPTDFDVAAGLVTWDGGFTVDATGNSIAELSNGWRPAFTGRAGAVISLDTTCGAPAACASRITYGTNWLPWEGTLIEGPWMIHEAGVYYLFYSANFYASAAYAIGVARASSPTGPFTKASAPVLVSRGGWAGPGHGSVVRAPGGGWVHVFHAWVSGSIGQAPGRQVLLERVAFDNGWPVMNAAPSSRSQPIP